MALNLEKGSNSINLTKSVPNVSKYTIGLAWDKDGDLDASIVVLNKGKRTDLVYFSNESAPGIKHNGDALDGFADGDDETIDIDLSKVSGDELIAVVTSYNSGVFSESSNPVARLYKTGDTTALIECKLDQEAAFGTALSLARFLKDDAGHWNFSNISESIGSSSNGLTDVIAKYA